MNVFYLQGEFGRSMQVKMRYTLHDGPLDFTITQLDDHTKLLVALTTDQGSSDFFSDSLVTIAMEEPPTEHVVASLPHAYTRLRSNLKMARKSFLAARYNSKIIDVIDIHRGSGDDQLSFEILKSIEGGHHLNYMDIALDKYHLITWSLDGLVFVYDLSDWGLLCKRQMNNRYTYGVRCAMCTPSGE